MEVEFKADGTHVARISGLAALLALAIALPTIADGQSATGKPFHIYAPSRTTESLLVFRATPANDGMSLAKVQAVDLDFSAATIVEHPSKPLAYVCESRTSADGKGARGAMVRFNSDGRCEVQQRMKLAHGYCYLSIDRSATRLLGVAYSGGQVDVYQLAPGSGALDERLFGLNEGRRNAHCVLPSPDNRHVYIPYVKESNALFQYYLEPTGKLTPLKPKNALSAAPSPPSVKVLADDARELGPRHMAYHPQLPLVYFSNEQQLGVSVFARAANGQLRLRQVCDFLPTDESKTGLSSSDIVMSPDGRRLFAGIRGHQRDLDGIARYQVRSDGSLRRLGLTPTGKIPWGLALSPDAQYLVVSAFQAGAIQVFRVLNDGDLKQVARIDCDKRISDLVCR